MILTQGPDFECIRAGVGTFYILERYYGRLHCNNG